MQRIPEPELMSEHAQAEAYARADFEEPNARFMDLLAALAGSTGVSGRVLDLGCGPADIARRIVRRWPGCSVDAVDGSAAMLAEARARMDEADASRIRLIETVLPSSALDRASYDFVLSNSLLHHLHEPSGLWQVVRRAARSGARVLVVDLARPSTPERARAIVDSYAAGEPEVLRRDFYGSLLAAFEPAEVQAQLAEAGLDHLEITTVSDRHLAVSGRIPHAMA